MQKLVITKDNTRVVNEKAVTHFRQSLEKTLVAGRDREQPFVLHVFHVIRISAHR